MNIVEPYARLLILNGQLTPIEKDGIDALRTIEHIGRVSHRSEDKQTEDSWKRFIPAVVMDHGDWSIVEHVSATVDFLVDRGITHEIVRHRLFSFTQESTRFVNYAKKMPPSFINPFSDADSVDVRQCWSDAIETAEYRYQRLLEHGCAPQIARSVFPNALASRLIVTGNLRNWRHFFIMRTTKEAHPQMRQVTIPLLAEFKALIPILFDDITPMDRQAEGMRRGR